MKTITSIYHRHFVFTYVLLVSVIFCGCGSETPKQDLTPIDKIYPIIDKIDAADGNGIRNMRLYVIDSCEYIGYINAFHSDVLTHKGNCKFCAERIKK
jgi:hypothetical protein